jgi:subtilase family serine protease
MNIKSLFASILLFVLLVVAGNSNALAVSENGLIHSQDARNNAPGTSVSEENSVKVCDRGNEDSAGCHARVVTDSKGSPNVSVAPSGYSPLQLHTAYSLPNTAAATVGPVIAIVDAYDHPNIQSDLNTYSAYFGIPQLPACTGAVGSSATPCFKKVDQRGGTAYPAINTGWALEIALDVEVAHAICQNCRVLLVEADSNSYANLMTAVDRAKTLGATIISNSYGGPEFSGETAYDSKFATPGVVSLVSSGDNGYGAEYPASSANVIAVGGTSLRLNSNNTYSSESAWAGAGSGCSAYEAKPVWQHDTACAKRTVSDISAVADPNTGAAIYDSVKYQGKSGWFKMGGTSLSAPLMAGVYGLGGVPSGAAGAALYAVASIGTNLHDVLTGSNGTCASYICKAGIGYDGPTGLGSPKGVGAF